MGSPAEPNQADWPPRGGGGGGGRRGNSRRAGPRDAPAASPISSEPGERVLVQRRSSSSSSTTIVVHHYEMKSTSATRGADADATVRHAAPNTWAHATRRPTNYANAALDNDNENENDSAPAAQRRPFSQADRLAAALAPSSHGQRAVDQVGRSSIESQRQQAQQSEEQRRQQQKRAQHAQERRQIMNNNNKAHWSDAPTNYVDRLSGAAAASGASGNASQERWRRAPMAPAAGSEHSPDEAHYSLVDAPDLQANSNGNGRKSASGRQHSAARQTNRSQFYANLFKTNNSGAPGEIASEHPGAHEQPRMGAARRAKSATLPAREGSHADSGYHQIGPPATRARHQQRLDRQQVLAQGQALRNDLITSMKSPQRASIRLGADVHQNWPAANNGSSDNYSMAPYGSLGTASQRASRSSLSARSSRVGKFVNYYPASRQPQSAGQRRQTGPYAFHVPPHRLRSLPPARPKSAGSTSNPMQLYDVYGGPAEPLLQPAEFGPLRGGLDESEDEHEAEHGEDKGPGEHLVAVGAEVKQTRFGYVAPLDRLESRQRPMALSKFNKSLKSRTIGHIPSMVQVSVDDDLLPAAHSARLAHAPHFLTHAYNNRSEGDLLKAHRVVWRHSDKFHAGHDNPFKPGTELSLEADLMVRFIKRGYPIDELPHLVQATKEVLAGKQRANSPAARSKSCDKLVGEPAASRTPKSTGYLSSNLCHFKNQADAPEADGRHDVRETNKHLHSVSQSHLLTSEKDGAQALFSPAHELEPSKRIWANSLSRAESMPRSNYCLAQAEAGNILKSRVLQSGTLNEDADSLDKLISDIEREISDLLVSNSSDQVSSGVCLREVVDNNEDSAAIGHLPTEAVKLKQHGSPKRKIWSPNPSLKRATKTSSGQQADKLASSTSTPSFALVKNDLTSIRSNELLLTSEANSRLNTKEKKKKKSRCCSIQ